MAKKGEVWAAGATRNLTAKQVKQGQRVVGGGRSEAVKKSEAKAAKQTVDIGTTKWQTKSERGGKGRGGLLTDQSGKAVTGTVKLPSGATATYVRGKRVMSGGTAARGGGGAPRGGGGNAPAAPKSPPKPRTGMEMPGGSSGRLSGPPISSRVSPRARKEGSGQIAKRSYNRAFLPGDRNMRSGETWSYTDQKGRKRNYRMDYGTTLLTRKNYAGPTAYGG